MSVRQDPSLYNTSQSARRGFMDYFGTEQQQAVVSWLYLLIAISCMHNDIRSIWVLALAEDLEARALKSSARTKAPGNTPRAKSRPTAQATRLAETAGAGRGVSSESVPTENPRPFHNLEQKAIFKKISQGSTCVLLLYCCTTVVYRPFGRPPWEKRKIRDYDHSTRNLTLR